MLAGLLVAAAVSGAVWINGYRENHVEYIGVHHVGSVNLFRAAAGTYSVKPRWVLPLSLFVAIGGISAAAAVMRRNA
jgi:hypothetical protein